MYIALSRIPGRGHSKCLTAGIGWGTAELFLSRFLTIWVGAKGIEFNWRYIQMSFDANISMVRIKFLDGFGRWMAIKICQFRFYVISDSAYHDICPGLVMVTT